jgi:hypothetical protein
LLGKHKTLSPDPSTTKTKTKPQTIAVLTNSVPHLRTLYFSIGCCAIYNLFVCLSIYLFIYFCGPGDGTQGFTTELHLQPCVVALTVGTDEEGCHLGLESPPMEGVTHHWFPPHSSCSSATCRGVFISLCE